MYRKRIAGRPKNYSDNEEIPDNNFFQRLFFLNSPVHFPPSEKVCVPLAIGFVYEWWTQVSAAW